jgi:hypothetical protein
MASKMRRCVWDLPTDPQELATFSQRLQENTPDIVCLKLLLFPRSETNYIHVVLLRHNFTVEDLVIDVRIGAGPLSQSLLHYVRSSTALRSISLCLPWSMQDLGANVSEMVCAMADNPKLVKVDLHAHHADPQSLAMLIRSPLRVLCLSLSVYAVFPVDCSVVAQSFAENHTLEELRIWRVEGADTFLASILSNLCDHPTLSMLHLALPWYLGQPTEELWSSLDLLLQCTRTLQHLSILKILPTIC